MHLAEHIMFLESHLISDFDHCLLGQTEMVFLFFLSFEAPLEHCRLCVGLVKLTSMREYSPQRADHFFRNSLFEHYVLTKLLMVQIPIDNYRDEENFHPMLLDHILQYFYTLRVPNLYIKKRIHFVFRGGAAQGMAMLVCLSIHTEMS